MPKIWLILLILITVFSLCGSVFVLNLYFNSQSSLAKQTVQFEEKNKLLNSQIEAQRNSKNDVRTQWESQLVSNDVLVQQVVLTQDAVKNYLAKPETKNNLTQVLNDLENQLKKNTEQKISTRDAVEKIYQRDQEDQQNRANPDGIR